MPNKPLLLLLCLLTSFSSFAQKAYYRKGYVVTIKGDTLSGYLERLNDYTLGKEVHFKGKENDNATITFHPADLICFYFEEEKIQFEPVEITLDINGQDTIQRRFGVLLVSGYCNLYNVALNEMEKPSIFELSSHVYIAKTGNRYTQLSETEKLDGSEYTLTKEYIDSIETLFSNCNSITNELIQKTDFSTGSMIKLFTAYNKCIDPGMTTVIHNTESPLEIKHGFEASYIAYYAPGIVGTPVSFSFGYFINLLKASVGENSSATLALNYMQLNEKIQDYIGATTLYNNSILRLHVLANHNFTDNRQSIIPFASAGATVYYDISYPQLLVEFPVGAGCYLGNKFVATILYNNFFNVFNKNNQQIIDFKIGYRLK